MIVGLDSLHPVRFVQSGRSSSVFTWMWTSICGLVTLQVSLIVSPWSSCFSQWLWLLLTTAFLWFHWLVVWNICYFSIQLRIIPTDELIFFRGVGWNHQPEAYGQPVSAFISAWFMSSWFSGVFKRASRSRRRKRTNQPDSTGGWSTDPAW